MAFSPTQIDEHSHTITPLSWWQIGLTILPGLYALALQFIRLNEIVPAISTVMHLALLASALWIALRRPPHCVPVWGLMPLGFLLGLGINTGVTGLLVLFAHSPLAYAAVVGLGVGWLLLALRPIETQARRRLSLIITGLVLLPILTLGGFDNWSLLPLHLTFFVNVIAGLYFARRSGLHAGLFVLGAGVFLMSFNIEQVIYFWDSPLWRDVLEASVPLLLYVITPIWVLRVRSVAGQATGLLLPIGVYFVLLVQGLVDAAGASLARAAGIAQPASLLLATMLYAVVLYRLARMRDTHAPIAQANGA
jgi:hypothetical protein